MRLIDADKLLEEAGKFYFEMKFKTDDEETILSSIQEFSDKINECYKKLIESQPTIQPQASINRGKWIRYEDTHEESVKYICPFCGDYTAFRGEISESTVNGNYIYCRHCGAKNGEDQ